MGKCSRVLLLQQIHLAGRTHTQTGALHQHMVLGLKTMHPVIRCDIQGQFITRQPAATTFITQQQLHTPTTSLMHQRPKPIVRIARVAQLASIKLVVGAFQFFCYLRLPETPALPAPALVKL